MKFQPIQMIVKATRFAQKMIDEPVPPLVKMIFSGVVGFGGFVLLVIGVFLFNPLLFILGSASAYGGLSLACVYGAEMEANEVRRQTNGPATDEKSTPDQKATVNDSSTKILSSLAKNDVTHTEVLPSAASIQPVTMFDAIKISFGEFFGSLFTRSQQNEYEKVSLDELPQQQP